MVSLAAASPAEMEKPAARRTSAPIDHAYLSRYTFGNKALELEVLQLFAEQAPDYLQALAQADTDKAWRDAAHTIKGSARAVGALVVAERAQRAEALRANPDPVARAMAVAALTEALHDVREHIAGLKA